MSYNNQELHSFLQVPGSENQDQSSFLSISPQRSTSPRSILSEQILNQQFPNQISNSATSNIGSFRTRSRAGTLPSRLYPNNAASSVPGQTQGYSPSFTSSSRNSFDPTALTFESLSISNASPAVEPTGQTTRGRSGSLFGISDPNSIWSTEGPTTATGIPIAPPQSAQQQIPQPQQVPINMMNDNFTQGRISPPKQPGFMSVQEEHIGRVRAYSTNNAPLNEPSHYYLQNYATQEDPLNYTHASEQLNSLGAIPEMVTHNRPRAQTMQNGGAHPIPIIRNSMGEIPENDSLKLKQIPTKPSLNEPLLRDKIDPRHLNWTSTYQDSSLGPTNTLIISNLPAHATSLYSLTNLLVNFGTVLSVRLFTGNESALVEFESLESAMNAKAQLHHQELVPGYSCLAAFAKILPLQQNHTNHQLPSPNLAPNQHEQPPHLYHQQPVAQPQPKTVSQQQQKQMNFGQPQQGHTPPDIHVEEEPAHEPVEVPRTIKSEPPVFTELIQDLKHCLSEMKANENTGAIHHMIENAMAYEGHDTDLGPLPAPLIMRQFDAPKLREIRKLIDSGSMNQLEIEEIGLSMLDELPELSSDYLGNTVVQKLFEFSDTSIKHIMLKEVSPYLAQMGVHKNGTWSAQKILSVADSPLQMTTVAKSLKPYAAPLFNDQYGNYVIQCCLKFGSPWNDFIFEAILAKFWLIAQNRYGARALRACLESSEVTQEQMTLVSAAIILHAEHLAINQNAALLITWFLDTCTLPNRHILLAPRLIPHLAQLCTHKLAGLTVLKILNNRNETEAKNLILTALFGSPLKKDDGIPEILFQILQDNTHGAGFVYKVLSNPQLEPEIRKHVVNQVRHTLTELNVSSFQGYKRLMDEVGLSNRTENRHIRNHSSGGSSRNKIRHNKSPQSYNGGTTSNGGNGSNRRSTPNSGYRGNGQQASQQQSMQMPAPAQPQFNDYDYIHQQSQQQQQQQQQQLAYQQAQLQQQQQQQHQHQSQYPQLFMTQQQQPEMFPFEQNGPASQQLPPQEAPLQNDFYQMQGMPAQYGYGSSNY